MNENAMLTGKPSIDRPSMKFYPEVLRGIQVPACTVEQYLSVRAADPNVVAMHYYGVDITWGTVFRKVDATARALQVLGIKQGDQIPVFLRSVPEFIYLLLAAERIGASLLCRDNTLEENIEAVQKANAKVIFVHDFFSKAEIPMLSFPLWKAATAPLCRFTCSIPWMPCIRMFPPVALIP